MATGFFVEEGGDVREVFAGEKRVASVPEVVEKLIKLGFKVLVQSGAGEAANFGDDAYKAAGAQIAPDAAALWNGADIVFKVRAPDAGEVGRMRAGQTLISFIWPAQNPDLMQQLAVLGFVSLGQTLVVLLGGIDLAIGALVSACTVFLANFLEWRPALVWVAVPLVLRG